MYEANTTVIGTIVNNPVKRDLPNGEQVLTFRMASNSRRLDHATGEWVDNGALFLTVSCWRRLVSGVDVSLHRGDPVLAHGQLRSREYRGRDGVERRDLEMRASAVGPDLARCTAQVTRWSADRWTDDQPPQEFSVAESGVLSAPLAPTQPPQHVTADEAVPTPV
ncbi:single-stranded DNA-binding protein [Nocardia brasiliensis]|uniref:single-stranded DNA-binding protein n=1 Tax=Nocardia brasiliensis TaxID=37326 RepID=UPI0005663CC9|nr:single-stranded DNA-binding protein [Nocardia brasiliensis]